MSRIDRGRTGRRRRAYFFVRFAAGFFFDLVAVKALFFALSAVRPPVFFPNADSQPSEYFFVVPTRTIVTAFILSCSRHSRSNASSFLLPQACKWVKWPV